MVKLGRSLFDFLPYDLKNVPPLKILDSVGLSTVRAFKKGLEKELSKSNETFIIM